jgi:Secretion system C-terminal sorting domain/Fibronectin type III domain
MKKLLTLFLSSLLALTLALPQRAEAQLGCPAPGNLSTTNIDLFSAQLNWTTSFLADNSILNIRPVGTNIWIPIIVQTLPFNAQALLCGTTYEWRVQALCQLGPIVLPSAFSPIQTFTTLSCNNLCPSPTALTSTNVFENTADLSWTPAFAFLTDYNLRYRVVGAANWIDVNNATTPTSLTGLNCSANYEWQVQTLCPNPFGNPIPGAWSGIETFSTATCLPCVVPTLLTSSNIAAFSATLSWNSAPAPAGSYQLRYRATGTTAWTLVSNAVSPFQLTAFTCNTGYDWQVRTVCPATPGNPSAFSPWSATQTFTTLTCPSGCTAPVALTASGISLQSAVLSWTATAPPTVTYQLRHRETGTTAWTLVNNAVSPFTLSNLNCKLSYDWQLRTVCGGGATPVTYSSWTNIQNFTTLDCDAFCPGPINMATTNITLNSAIFTWSVQAPLPVGSQVRYRAIGTTAWTLITAAVSPMQVTGLTCGTNYEWQVRTDCNGIGTLTFSPWSVKVNFTTLSCTAACPDAVSLSTSNIALYSATANWSLVTPAPVGFDIRYRLVGAANWIQLNNVTSPVQLTGLTCSSNYEWEVRTVCGNSVSNDPFSAWSVTQSFSTLTCTFACPAPVGLTATNISDTGALIAWVATAPGAVTYQFRYRVNGTTAWTPVINNTAASSFQLANLVCATTYQWQVRTVCGAPGAVSYSAWSGMSNFATAVCPVGVEANAVRVALPAKFDVTVYPNPADDMVTVSWSMENASTIRFEMHDMLGRSVYQGANISAAGLNEIEIPTATLKAGWYSVTISDETNTSTKRLLIGH